MKAFGNAPVQKMALVDSDKPDVSLCESRSNLGRPMTEAKSKIARSHRLLRAQFPQRNGGTRVIRFRVLQTKNTIITG